jgi:hypothetical protein
MTPYDGIWGRFDDAYEIESSQYQAPVLQVL